MNLPIRTECRACTLHETAKSIGIPYVWDVGSLPLAPGTPLLVFVGERPGPDEDRTGRPFVGPAGLALRASDGFLGAIPNVRSRASLIYGNLVRCFSGGETPHASCFKACLPHSTADLSALIEATPGSRRLLVCLGLAPSKHLGGHDTLLAATAHQLDEPIPGFRAVYTYNPAYFNKEPAIDRAMQGHFEIVSRWLDGHDAPTLQVPWSWATGQPPKGS